VERHFPEHRPCYGEQVLRDSAVFARPWKGTREVILDGEDQLADLQKSIDAAVGDAARWRDVCDRLAGVLGGVGSVFVPSAIGDRTPEVVASESLGELIETVFRDGWIERNYRERSVPIIQARGYATDLDIADEDTMKLEPFYADLLASHKLGIFAGLRVPGGREGFVAAIERSIKAPPPDSEMFRRMAASQRMLASGVRTSAAIGAAHMQSWRELTVESDRPIFVLDELGRLVDRNAATEPLLGSVFALTGSALRLVSPVADRPFVHLVSAALVPEPGVALPRPVFVEAPGQGLLMVDVVRIPRLLRHFHSLAAALVVARPVAGARPSLTDALKRSAGLTDTEVRLALALFEGLTLSEYAERNGVAVGTARQQVKSVFRKTGAGRQAELVALIHRLAAGD
jgi:DNA-binding CsgD family transcriptional regulator